MTLKEDIELEGNLFNVLSHGIRRDQDAEVKDDSIALNAAAHRPNVRTNQTDSCSGRLGDDIVKPGQAIAGLGSTHGAQFGFVGTTLGLEEPFMKNTFVA
jgi:hypothetical protein